MEELSYPAVQFVNVNTTFDGALAATAGFPLTRVVIVAVIEGILYLYLHSSIDIEMFEKTIREYR